MPLPSPPKHGNPYWVPITWKTKPEAFKAKWDGGLIDQRRLRQGIVFDSLIACQKHMQNP